MLPNKRKTKWGKLLSKPMIWWGKLNFLMIKMFRKIKITKEQRNCWFKIYNPKWNHLGLSATNSSPSNRIYWKRLIIWTHCLLNSKAYLKITLMLLSIQIVLNLNHSIWAALLLIWNQERIEFHTDPKAPSILTSKPLGTYHSSFLS